MIQINPVLANHYQYAGMMIGPVIYVEKLPPSLRLVLEQFFTRYRHLLGWLHLLMFVFFATVINYKLAFSFTPPDGHSFMRHVDKETGVAPWWQPFTLNYDFAWIGSTGKKGGY